MGLFGKKKLPMEAVMSYQPPSIDGEPMPIPQQAAMPQLDSMGRKPLTKTQKMLGILADGLAGFAGTTPQFAPMMQRERDEENQFRYVGQLREQQRAQGREDFLWKQENNRSQPRVNDTIEDFNFFKGLSAEDRVTYGQMKPVIAYRADGSSYTVNPMQLGGAPPPFAGWGDEKGGPASDAPVNFPAARR